MKPLRGLYGPRVVRDYRRTSLRQSRRWAMPPDMPPRPLPEPVDIARARRAQLLAAISAVERALAVPARDPTWTTRVEAGIDRLAEAFDAHVVATEGADGMYAEILRHAPRLSFAVGQL